MRLSLPGCGFSGWLPSWEENQEEVGATQNTERTLKGAHWEYELIPLFTVGRLRLGRMSDHPAGKRSGGLDERVGLQPKTGAASRASRMC